METKLCTKCNESKPVSEFSRHRHMKDGRQRWCNLSKSDKTPEEYWAFLRTTKGPMPIKEPSLVPDN